MTMGSLRGWVLTAVFAAAAGCSSSNEDAPAGSGAAAAETESEAETVFDPLTDTLERANDVSATIDERARELRRRIDEDSQ
jgi:hypothetical protein